MSASHYAQNVARPKRRHPRPPRNPTPGGVPASAIGPSSPPVPRAILAWPELRRRWLFRCAALVLVPALLLGTFEGALRLLHIGYPTQSFFQEAEEVDDHFADLHFRLAECYDALDEMPKALEHYTLACDWDALQFRAPSRLNQLIRQDVAHRENEGLHLLDLERGFARSPLSDRGIPGRHLFNDHVHLSFAGDYLVACSLLPVVAQALRLGPADQPPLTQEACARRLAFTTWDAYSVQATMAKLTARPPFLDRLDHPERQAQALQAVEQSRQAVEKEGMAQVTEIYRQAVARTPNDWQLHFNFGRLLIALKQHTAALAECTRTVELFPYAPELRVRLAGALVNAGRPDRALAELREALRLDPANPAAQAALKSLTSDQEKGY